MLDFFRLSARISDDEVSRCWNFVLWFDAIWFVKINLPFVDDEIGNNVGRRTFVTFITFVIIWTGFALLLSVLIACFSFIRVAVIVAVSPGDCTIFSLLFSFEITAFVDFFAGELVVFNFSKLPHSKQINFCNKKQTIKKDVVFYFWNLPLVRLLYFYWIAVNHMNSDVIVDVLSNCQCMKIDCHSIHINTVWFRCAPMNVLPNFLDTKMLCCKSVSIKKNNICFIKISLASSKQKKIQIYLTSHLNGFSPVWHRSCTFSWPLLRKLVPQKLHKCFFSPLWINKCAFNVFWVINFDPHSLQVKTRMVPHFDSMCCLREIFFYCFFDFWRPWLVG